MSKTRRDSFGWFLGHVHWFDELSGEGMIKDADGDLYYVHRSAIDADRRSKIKTLKNKQKVKFQLIEDTTFVQVSRVKEITQNK